LLLTINKWKKLANIEFKIIDVPEMNYTIKDKDEKGFYRPRGELYMRGPGIFKGYFRNDDNTKEALDDAGWLKTGDIV